MRLFLLTSYTVDISWLAYSNFCVIKILFKGIVQAKMVKIIKFLFFAQKVSSGMGALRPKFLGG